MPEDPCLGPLARRLVIINYLALIDDTKLFFFFGHTWAGERRLVDPWNLEFILP